MRRAQAAGRLRFADARAAALAFLGTLQAYVFMHRVARISPAVPLELYIDTVVEVWKRGALPARRTRDETTLGAPGPVPARPRRRVLALAARPGAQAPHPLGSDRGANVEVGSLTGGRVARVHVDEGAQVKTGDPIVTLETDLIDLQIRGAGRRVAAARANLAKAERGPRVEDMARARAEAANAERERARLDNLLEKGVIGQQQYDDAATKARMASESLLERERGSRPEDIAAARAALATEEGQLAYLNRQREEAVVKSPAAGLIESMDLRPGDIVGPNQPVARILEPSQLWVRVYVPEPQLGRVRVGQQASVTVDTFPAA